MLDYTLLGELVQTPGGWGRYLEHKNGKVLVFFGYDCPPVEFDAIEVYLT
jgi:hypothetical protein